ncbi:SagB family peptide dehydrogenase [Bacillus cytotoxicus]|uniref:SagB family peptide dehydrogenase n=1 Tax=Bacillus cereus group TaxID=86661 RepID=UPI001AEE782E|nr:MULTISPECIES: SagB family peptide dehydrogenase [Bacillus cereus group]MDH2880851.1 SagB family peptide dehydrogenase [Bacillus cytotoxicus]QTR77623.1 SagB family peptide dehydrogenase [Bacillus cytotoxicus]QTR82556.1 SagB family peptide dehydrogenase [Bacillus cytotoxicus]QTR86294.1 SagB family peptide dehydrogenase [Bacillus cytotoxicus]HDR4572233.1 SagB family peptide dehydrogenase [Bacillus cytotoxicus]
MKLSKEVTWWDTDFDRSSLRKYFHKHSISRRNYTSVQIKKVKGSKKWDKYEGIALQKYSSKVQIEEILKRRRTRRVRSEVNITKEILSKLLLFSVGITDSENNYFAYPSPGALYPCTLFLTINLPDFKDDIYRYNPYKHMLEKYSLNTGHYLDEVVIDNQLAKFPLKIFFTSDYQLLEDKYGELSYRLLNQEIGHMAQNISLYAEYLGLNTTCIGGFYEEEFKKYIKEYDLLYVMVVG